MNDIRFPDRALDEAIFSCVFFDNDAARAASVSAWWERPFHHADDWKKAWEKILAELPAVMPAESEEWAGFVAVRAAGGVRAVVFGNAAFVSAHGNRTKILAESTPRANGEPKEEFYARPEAPGELLVKMTARGEAGDEELSVPLPLPDGQKKKSQDAGLLEQFQTGWDDLFTYGTATGNIARRAAERTASDMGKWTAAVGVRALMPAVGLERWWEALPFDKRAVSRAGIGIAAALFIGLWGGSMPASLQRQSPVSLWGGANVDRRAIAERQLAAEQALVYADRERAAALLRENEESIASLPEDDALAQAQRSLEKNLANVETRADEVALLDDTRGIADAATVGNYLLAVGKDFGLRWYDLSGKKIVAAAPLTGEPLAVHCPGTDCFVMTRERVLKLDTGAARLGQIAKEWKLPKGLDAAKAVDFRVREGTAYVLMQNGKDWSVVKSKLGTNMGSVATSVKPQEGQAKYLRVNKDITVYHWPAGNGTGVAETWLSGKRTSRGALNYGGALANDAALANHAGADAYWLDPAHDRIAVSVGGRFTKQIVKSGWNAYRLIVPFGKRVLLIGDKAISVTWPNFDGIR